MLPIIPKPAISQRQKALAVGVAGFVDLLQLVVFPAFGWGILSPMQSALDVMTVLVLASICGLKWQFMAGFVLELVPGLALFPTWTAVAITLPSAATRGEPALNQGVHGSRVDRRHPPIQVQARVVPNTPPAPPPVQRQPAQPPR
jgi:hypothetical protein